MSDPHWYRSLYWRLGLGLVAFFAVMLAAQGALYLWMTDRLAGSMPARDPRRLAALVGANISGELEANPALDLERYVRDEFGGVLQTFLVLMDDGRAVTNHEEVPAELEAMRMELARQPRGRGFGPRGPGGPPPAEGSRGGRRGRRGEPPPGGRGGP